VGLNIKEFEDHIKRFAVVLVVIFSHEYVLNHNALSLQSGQYRFHGGGVEFHVDAELTLIGVIDHDAQQFRTIFFNPSGQL
jgi:hypothetical protein